MSLTLADVLLLAVSFPDAIVDGGEWHPVGHYDDGLRAVLICSVSIPRGMYNKQGT